MGAFKFFAPAEITVPQYVRRITQSAPSGRQMYYERFNLHYGVSACVPISR